MPHREVQFCLYQSMAHREWWAVLEVWRDIESDPSTRGMEKCEVVWAVHKGPILFPTCQHHLITLPPLFQSQFLVSHVKVWYQYIKYHNYIQVIITHFHFWIMGRSLLCHPSNVCHQHIHNACSLYIYIYIYILTI